MRLWSLHPRMLDQKGLGSVWREGLLAKAVLSNKTKGYRHHPQLERFKKHPAPVLAVCSYLVNVWNEAHSRGYNYDFSKTGIMSPIPVDRIPVTKGQVQYEIQFLLKKMRKRDRQMYNIIHKEVNAAEFSMERAVAPMFFVVDGEIESWEKVPKKKAKVQK